MSSFTHSRRRGREKIRSTLIPVVQGPEGSAFHPKMFVRAQRPRRRGVIHSPGGKLGSWCRDNKRNALDEADGRASTYGRPCCSGRRGSRERSVTTSPTISGDGIYPGRRASIPCIWIPHRSEPHTSPIPTLSRSVDCKSLSSCFRFLPSCQAGSDRNDRFYAAAAADDGSVVMCGCTYGSYAGPNHGYSDAVAVKLDSDGSELWRWQVGRHVKGCIYFETRLTP